MAEDANTNTNTQTPPAPQDKTVRENSLTEGKSVPKEAFDTVKNEKISLENERNTLKAQLAKIEADAEKVKADTLAKQGEFEKLYTEEKTRNETLAEGLKQTKLRAAFDRAAAEAKVIDLDAAFKLADLSKVVIDGDNVTGVTEAIKALTESKPYLAGTGETTPQVKVGNGATGGADPGSITTVEQIAAECGRDPSAWSRNKEKWTPILQQAGVNLM